MKKNIILAGYLVAVFMVALILISSIMNKGNTDMTAQMSEATFPVIYLNIDSYKTDMLHGFAQTMNTSYLRDTLLPVGRDRSVRFHVDNFQSSVNSISYEVRTLDGERLVENNEIEEFEQTDKGIDCKIVLKDLIETDTEYMLCIILSTDYEEAIYYYTRIIQSDELYVSEKLDYISDFHNRTFDKDAAVEITKYLESNSEGDNSTFDKVNIHSSFDQITWGDLLVQRITEPVITINDLTQQTGSFHNDYFVSVREGNDTHYYKCSEYYRIRYTSERTYLLDFERTMKQVFFEDEDVFVEDKIMLGIYPNDIPLVESDGGNVFAFVVSDKLYSFSVNDQKLARIFAFSENKGQALDPRCNYDANDIKILSVDETGNVKFLVYGYMNRGKHEGEMGACVYQYNSMLNTIEEKAYISYDKSFDLMKTSIEELSYLNNAGKFFFLLDETLYGIDTEYGNMQVFAEGLCEGNYTASDSCKMIVWQDGHDKYSSSALKLYNLDMETYTDISAMSGECISLIGFMNEDLVYGLARQDDIVVDVSGKTLFPMYCIRIQSETGNVLKTYREEGTYVVAGAINGTQINLTRVIKNEDSGTYEYAADDQIVSSESVAVGANQVESIVTDIYETRRQIVCKDIIDSKKMVVLTPREVLYEGSREIKLALPEGEDDNFYAYARGELDGIYVSAGNAVDYAYDVSGCVVDGKGRYLWRKVSRSSRNQIMAIEAEEASEENSSLAVCLDTILKLEGSSKRTKYLLDKGETIDTILESNLKDTVILDLTGCDLDAVLYYVNMDIPVLASLPDENAVLIIGFNELNIVLMDPSDGTIYKKGMNDSKEFFEENGNRFITYMRYED